MSFTFNWAGLSIPTATRADNSARTIEAGANLGTAARGAQNMIYDREYSQMVADHKDTDPKIAEIEAQIKQLEADNARLMRQRAQLAG